MSTRDAEAQLIDLLMNLRPAVDIVPVLAKAAQFKGGRRKGAISDTTKYIHALARRHSKRPAHWLFGNADKKVIGKMAFSTFERHVSKAREKI